ncbi:MAG TPA: oligopeptide ABC transporter permease [Bacillota bacterium]|nr:oligopeptide ABC transporter permease [Bacillota bacterium]
MQRVPFKDFVARDPSFIQGGEQRESQVIRKFYKNKLALWGFIILVLIVFSAVFASFLTVYPPSEQDLLHRLQPPSVIHPFGTDEYGRDILSRLLYGARVSLIVGFASVAGSLLIGTLVGAIAGYYGGWVDNVFMRFVDLLNAFPAIFLLITIVTLLEPKLANIILVFILLGWTTTARLVRGEFLKLKEEEYVWAARSVGMSDARIIFGHLLPNASAPIIVAATLGVGNVILAESGLSFLGLGIQPPIPSWGNMLQGAQSLSVMVTAPWYPFFPGMMILLTVLAFNFLGDGLRDALDPR